MGKLSVSEKCSSIDVCRICLQTDEYLKNLFDESSKNILDKIFSCFQIILRYEDYLPSKICSNCSKELDCAFNFRLKCVTFEERYSKIGLKHDHSSYNNDDTNTDEDPRAAVENNIIQNHLNPTYNEIEEDVFKCRICYKVLKTKPSLLKHTILMHQNNKKVGKVTGSGISRRYHCTECPYSTPHKQTLVNHMRRHNGEKPYLCECGKSFTQAASLTAHKKTHSDNKCYTCSKCGKQFKHAFSLKKHFRVHEDGTFLCSVCQKRLKSAQSLHSHMNRHNNIRNFNCEECGATFVSGPELLSHRKMHSKVMNAECHICGYKTHAKKNLIVHIKRHTGEKVFKCDLCSMATYTHGDLRRHQRVHSREKPYQCPVCTQRFSHSGTLNRHAHKVHGLQYRWGESKTKKKLVSTLKQEET